ncbi:MAG: hypothetical protein IJN00_01385 [Clostridia bacterium]|nr:hypothetical protein [Clostridia bacterium]
MRKKLVCILLVVMLALAAVGCGNGGSGPESAITQYTKALADNDYDECIALTKTSSVSLIKTQLSSGTDLFQNAVLESLLAVFFSDLSVKTQSVSINGSSAAVQCSFYNIDVAKAYLFIVERLQVYISDYQAGGFDDTDIAQKVPFWIESIVKDAEFTEKVTRINLTVVNENGQWLLSEDDALLKGLFEGSDFYSLFSQTTPPTVPTPDPAVTTPTPSPTTPQIQIITPDN